MTAKERVLKELPGWSEEQLQHALQEAEKKKSEPSDADA